MISPINMAIGIVAVTVNSPRALGEQVDDDERQNADQDDDDEEHAGRPGEAPQTSQRVVGQLGERPAVAA
jgi:hypothetical protein